MNIVSIKSINNICNNLVNGNDSKAVHLRNNKLILENKELREKVRMLNEKLAYHQTGNKSIENSKKKLPPLKNVNDNFKLPTIQNKSSSITEAKDNSRIKTSMLQNSKGVIPIINKKNTNVVSNNNISDIIDDSYNNQTNKLSNEYKNIILNDFNDIPISSSITKNSSYYQKLFDSSKTIVDMDSDISRKNYKIKLKQDIENLDQEINNWS
ncbi:hypothetical protein LY90DRAFT_676782 [Neocallimastix californiae]|uniref:Uncharacterized protein n=1 Tax=Neocallimastix californiae TaxID=1754190 RepID=A0A1Y2ADP6_9FUNG|nr:hypothetical protein LY90DRAFT_676782 [Neocallimastix californiae]|eukprot:ORY20410.1 hypothetical protein LY90DRAFT_676782 [Neocallimastix californiae]